MRNLLAFLAAAVLTLAGVGWYLDWYHIRSTPIDGGQKSVTVDINTKKITEDLIRAEQKIQQRLAEKANGGSGEDKKALDIPAPKSPDHVGN